MRISFFTDYGQSYEIDIDPHMELENIMALLEAESDIPPAEQSISHNGTELNDPKKSLSDYGVGPNAMLLLRRKVSVAGRTVQQDAEMMRLQLLGDPNLMNQIRQTQPELADAIQNNPARFAELLRYHRQRLAEVEQSRNRDIDALNADPFDVEAQRRIEEAIRQQAVMENLEHAMEYSPESFGRVTMLYIPVEVNGKPVKAFVDSGAQQTIISPDCAEACGIMRLIDTRFSGIAKGVGTARILGRVHSAQLKLADLHLSCAFTVMEGRDVDLLFGLDMLRAHQACIDLEKNVLRIQGREVPFLAEHELPDKARIDVSADLEEPPQQPQQQTASSSSSGHFPGAGNTLGGAPQAQPRHASQQGQPASRWPEQDIQSLENLGATREQAIGYLNAAGGNVDIAASFLFN